jgi:hypothetical protein
VYVAGGTVSLSNDIFSGNKAQGGTGGNGGNGGNGGSGGNGRGGGLYVAGGTVTLNNDTLSGNHAQGGKGGNGGTSGGGGMGGNGSGGGLYVVSTGSVTLTKDPLSGNNAQGGNGGNPGPRGIRIPIITRGSGGIFVGGGGTLDLSNSMIAGISASVIVARDSGGGIYNSGSLTVSDSTLSGNSTSGDGGGIYNTGSLTVSGSTLSGNSAVDGSGGGITNFGTLTVSDSTLSGNSAASGGGIYNTGGLTVSGSTLSGNSATSYYFGGGAIYNSGSLTVSDSTLSGNSAHEGGGIENSDGTLTVSGSTLSGNSASGDGGGIYNTGTGSLMVSDSTLSGNSAFTGGGIFVGGGGTLNLSNSTIAANIAESSGDSPGTGGIENFGATTLVNSIVADNSNFDVSRESGTVTLNGPNLVQQSSGTISGTPITSDPNLGPLQNNGGDTDTLAILTTSPAAKVGDISRLNGVTTDQRGFARVVNGQLDLGAFQIQAGEVNVSPLSVFFRFADQSVNLSATVTAPGLSNVNGGEVTFTVLGQTLPPVNVVNGVASTTLRIPGGTRPGTYMITAVYDGSPELRDSTTTGTLLVKPELTGTTLASNVSVPYTILDPQPLFNTTTLTANLTDSEGSLLNEGEVQFVVKDLSGAQLGGKLIAEVQRGQASATFIVPPRTALGNYTITAQYNDNSPNPVFATSSGSGTLTVAPSPTTVTSNNVSVFYTLLGEQDTITAYVLGNPQTGGQGFLVNGGFVTLSYSGQTVTVPVINSVATATFNIPLIAEIQFTHSITATYSPGGNNYLASSSTYTINEAQIILDFLIQLMILESIMNSMSGQS